MPEQLKQSEVDKGQDPTVAKAFDNETLPGQKFEDFYAIADKLKIAMLGTLREGTGPVGRAMAVNRSGPDFLLLANANSQKFDDIEKNKIANLYFQDSSTQDWISVTGEAVTSSNTDPRIKEIYNKYISAWFGDLGDGVHTGGPEDPRMKLIEIQPKYISYWKHEVSKLGFAGEIAGALLTGGVAVTGSLRQMNGDEIQAARERDGKLSSK